MLLLPNKCSNIVVIVVKQMKKSAFLLSMQIFEIIQKTVQKLKNTFLECRLAILLVLNMYLLTGFLNLKEPVCKK